MQSIHNSSWKTCSPWKIPFIPVLYDDPFTGIRYEGELSPYNWTIPKIDLPQTFTFTKPGVEINVNVNKESGVKNTNKDNSSKEKKEADKKGMSSN